MAQGTTQWTLQINADTSRAKKDINNLLQSLNKVNNLNLDQLGITTEIREAAQAAQQLKLHLQAATNASTGQLNLVEFNRSIQQSGQSMASLMATLAQGGQTGQQAFQQMATTIANTQVPIRQTNKLLTNMMTTLKNSVKWELSSMFVKGIRTSIAGAIGYVKDLNSSLNDIRVVTNKSVEEMARFTNQARIAAQELSTTTKAFTDASLIYFQQGDSMELAAKKAAITIKAANASFNSSAAEMSEYLTAVWNSYQVGADELEHYVDIMAQLGASTATSMEEIATSMQKVAATANTVGVSMEQVSSIIATVSSVTRESAESIGTSFKTIFARIGDLKLGETLEDGVNLGQVSSELNKIGVSILDANGQMRDMGTIIEDLMSKWQTMTRAEQTAVAQVVAGKRQYTQLIALMENDDKYAKNKNLAENSDGSLQKMQDIHVESAEAAATRTRESIQTLYSTLLDDKALIGFQKIIKGIVDNITNLSKSLGGLKGIVGAVGSILLRTFSGKIASGIKQMGAGIASFMTNGSYKQQYIKTLEQTNTELSNSRSWGDTATLQATTKMIDLKSRLLGMENSLTAAQAQQMQLALSGASEQIGALNQLEQEYLDVERAIKSGTSSMAGWAAQSYQIRENGKTRTTTFNQQLSAQMSSEKFMTGSGANRMSAGGFFSAAQINAGGTTAANMLPQINQLNQIQSIGQTTAQVLEQIRNPAELTQQEFTKITQQVELMKAALKGTAHANVLDNITAESLKTKEGIQSLSDAITMLNEKSQTDFNGFTTAFRAALTAMPNNELKNRLSTLFDKFTTDSDHSAEALQRFKMQVQDVINSLNNTESALDRLNGKMNKAFGAISKGVGTAMSAVSGFNMLSQSTQQLASGSDNLSNNIATLLSGLMMIISIAPAIGTALTTAFGPIGWAIGALAAIVAAVAAVTNGISKAKKETYQNRQKESLEKNQEQIDAKNEEVENNHNLIKSYNDLYATYIETGEGQEELAASARALADAYGLVGANVLIAQGNFEAFNNYLADNMGFDSELKFYRNKREALIRDFADNSKNSLFQTQNLDLVHHTGADLASNVGHSIVGSQYYSYVENPETGQYRTDFIGRSEDGSVISFGEAMNGFLSQERDYFLPASSNWNITKDNDYMSDYDFPGKDGIYTDASINAQQAGNIYQYYLDMFGGIREYADAAFVQAMEGVFSKDSIFIDDNGNISGTTIDESFWTDIINEAWSSGANGEEIFDASAMTDVLKEQDWAGIVGNTETFMWDVTQEALGGIFGKYQSDLIEEYFGEGGMFGQTDYLTDILGEDLMLDWDNLSAEGKYNQFNKIVSAIQSMDEEMREVQEEMTNLDENSQEYQILQEYYDYIKSISDSYKRAINYDDYIAEGSTAQEMVKEIEEVERMEAEIKVLKESMKVFYGKSEATEGFGFTGFMTGVKAMESAIDKTAGSYEELQKYLVDADNNGEFDKDEKGNYIIAEGMGKEYIAARNKLVSQLLKDYTAFDDFIYLYQDLVSLFDSQEDIDLAASFLEAFDINKVQQVDSAFYYELQQFIKNDAENAQKIIEDYQTQRAQWIENGATAEEIALNTQELFNNANQGLLGKMILANQDALAFDTANQMNTSAKTWAEGFKDNEDMSIDEATAFYKQYADYQERFVESGLGEIKSWEDFVAMDYTERAAYLASLAEQSEENAEERARTALASATEARQDWEGAHDFKDKEAFEEYASSYRQYAATISELGYNVAYGEKGEITVTDKDGNPIDNMGAFYKEISFDQEQVSNFQNAEALINAGSQVYLDEENAEAVVMGLELMSDGIVTAEEKMTAASEAVTALSKGLEHFNETGQISAEVFKTLGKLGIQVNKDDIKNIQDFIKLMTQARQKGQQAVNSQIAEYNKSYAEQYGAFNVNQTWDMSLIETDEEYRARYEAWEKVIELMTQVEGIDAEINSARDQITQQQIDLFDAQMASLQQSRDELQKTAEAMKEAADILSGAIEDGSLSFADQAKLDAAGITAWAEGATYAERIEAAALGTAKATNQAMTNQLNLNSAIDQAELLFNVYTDLTSGKITLKDSQLFDSSNSLISWLMDPSYKASHLTEGAKNAIIEADKIVRQTLDANTATTGEYWTKMQAQLQIMGQEGADALSLIMAEGKDNIVSLYSELGQHEADLANQFVENWMNAFQSVANMRRSILMGEDISSDLTSSFDNFNQIANQYKGGGAALIADQLSGNLGLDKLTLPDPVEMIEGIRDARGLGKSDRIFEYDQDEGMFARTDWMNMGAMMGMNRNATTTTTNEQGEIISAPVWKDDAEYVKAVQDRITPQLETLLNGYDLTGTDFETIGDVILGYFAGAPEAIAILNDAANKTYENSEAYGEYLEKENILREAEAAYQTEVEEQQKVQDKALGFADATEAIYALAPEDRDATSIASILEQQGITQADYIAALQEKGYNVSNLEDIAGLSNDALLGIEDTFQQDATEAGAIIISAGEAFKEIATEEGTLGEDGAGITLGDKNFTEGAGFAETSDAVQPMIETVNENTKAQTILAEDISTIDPKEDWETEMGHFGLDAKEVDEFGDHLQKISKESEELSDQLEKDADAADEVAKEVKRYGKAVDSITDNYKDWNKALKGNDLDAQAKAVKQMDKAYSDMLDLDYDSLSNDFLTNAENLELMRQAAEGSEEAYNELAARAEDDLLIQAGIDINDQAAWEKINNLQNQIHNSIDDIEIGATIDDSGAIAAMEELINMAGMTADEATNYLASMGVDAEVVENTTTQEETAATNLVANTGVRTVGYTVPAAEPGGSPTRAVASFPVVTYTAVPVTTTKTVKAAGLKVTSAKKSSGGGFKHRASGGGKGGKGGGGGGGGGGSASTHDTRQEPERYHENTKKYNHVQNALDKLGKAQERSYGKGYLQNLQKEADLLQEQIDLMNEKMDMIKNSEDGGYYLIDLNALEEALDETMELLGSETQWDLQINPDTLHIENWEEIEAELTSLYDKLANTSMTDEAWEEITKQIDTYEELMEQYEETVELLEETGLTLEELINAWQEKNLEMITYKVEYQVELNEHDLELLEYYAEIFEDDLGSFGELMTNLTQQAEETTDNLSIVQQGIADLNTAYANGDINLAQYQETLADFNSQLLDNLSGLHDLEEQIQELYAEALNKAQDELDKHLNKLDYIASIMEKYVDIQSLLGKGIDRKYLDSLYKVQIAAQQQSVASQKAMYDELLQRKQAFEAKMQEQGSLSETEQEQYEALMETFMEVHENMLDTLQATLETMRTQYENTIESIFEDFEENMLGAAWSLQGLADSYSYYQEVQDRQLSAAQEIYQMSKLNRQIEQSIEDATTKANKQILKDLQAQIKARAELGEMTEYDIEMMDLQYQMALKKMALEEAQAAKSVVRLTRDNDGNYAYQYTADEDQVNQAYQEYEDVLAQINDLASSRVGELEQQMLDAQQTYLEKLKELALDETMTEEQKIRKKQELYEQYQETLMWIQEQYQIATGDLENNLAASSSWYNTTITKDSGLAKEKLAAMIGDAEKWVEAYWNLINGEDNSISSAFTDYTAAIAKVNDIIQTLLTEEGAQAYLDMAENAGTMAHEVVQQLNGELDEIDAVTAAWDAQKTAIEGVKNQYEALAGQINNVIRALSQLTDEERQALTPEAFAAYWAAAGENRQRTEQEQRAAAERNHRTDNDPRTEEEKREDAEIEANAGMPTQDEQKANENREKRDTVYRENVQKSSGTSTTMVTEISDILEAKLQALLGELMTYSGADMVVKDSTIDTTYITQEVEINAEFPNVEDMQDIKDAFDMLINEASQRAGRNRP